MGPRHGWAPMGPGYEWTLGRDGPSVSLGAGLGYAPGMDGTWTGMGQGMDGLLALAGLWPGWASLDSQDGWALGMNWPL